MRAYDLLLAQAVLATFILGAGLPTCLGEFALIPVQNRTCVYFCVHYIWCNNSSSPALGKSAPAAASLFSVGEIGARVGEKFCNRLAAQTCPILSPNHMQQYKVRAVACNVVGSTPAMYSTL